jgi:hypothetical protein
VCLRFSSRNPCKEAATVSDLKTSMAQAVTATSSCHRTSIPSPKAQLINSFPTLFTNAVNVVVSLNADGRRLTCKGSVDNIVTVSVLWISNEKTPDAFAGNLITNISGDASADRFNIVGCEFELGIRICMAEVGRF